MQLAPSYVNILWAKVGLALGFHFISCHGRSLPYIFGSSYQSEVSIKCIRKMDEPIQTAYKDYVPLSDQEINAFFQVLDTDKDGYVTFDELEAKLHQVHDELAPEPQKHHLHHPTRRDLEQNQGHAGDGLHAFLCNLMPDCGSKLSREEFVKHVEPW